MLGQEKLTDGLILKNGVAGLYRATETMGDVIP